MKRLINALSLVMLLAGFAPIVAVAGCPNHSDCVEQCDESTGECRCAASPA